MSLADRFAVFFRSAEDEMEDASYAEQREILDWMGQAYHEKFEKWLDAEASKPFAVTNDQLGMVQSVVRANTFREIKRHLEVLRQRAVAAVRQAREDANV